MLVSCSPVMHINHTALIHRTVRVDHKLQGIGTWYPSNTHLLSLQHADIQKHWLLLYTTRIMGVCVCVCARACMHVCVCVRKRLYLCTTDKSPCSVFMLVLLLWSQRPGFDQYEFLMWYPGNVRLSMAISGLAGEITVSQALRFVPSSARAWARSNVTLREMVWAGDRWRLIVEGSGRGGADNDTDTYA